MRGATEYDAAVAGAGPAGLATARNIARAGLRVLVIEKHPSVGEPVLCSGLVSPRCLEEAEGSRELVLGEIKGVSVHSTSGKELNLGGERTYALAIDRAGLERDLAEQAEGAGAQLLLGGELVGIEREGQRLRLAISGNGGGREIVARILVGADGVGSLVGRWMGVHSSDGAVRVAAGEGWLRGTEPDIAQVFVGSAMAPGWFGWIIPLGDGRVRVGTGDGKHSRIPVKQLFDKMVAAFPAQFKGLRLDRFWTKAIPVYSPGKTSDDNVLLVGDAARQVKPHSGGGIYTGLVGARHCARVAVEALEKGDCSEAFLSQYEAAWKGELGAELERGLDLRRAFLSLTDEEMDQILDICGAPLLQRLVSRFGDIDFPSSVTEQLVRAAPMLRFFLRVSLRFPFRWPVDSSASLGESGRSA